MPPHAFSMSANSQRTPKVGVSFLVHCAERHVEAHCHPPEVFTHVAADVPATRSFFAAHLFLIPLASPRALLRCQQYGHWHKKSGWNLFHFNHFGATTSSTSVPLRSEVAQRHRFELLDASARKGRLLEKARFSWKKNTAGDDAWSQVSTPHATRLPRSNRSRSGQEQKSDMTLQAYVHRSLSRLCEISGRSQTS